MAVAPIFDFRAQDKQNVQSALDAARAIFPVKGATRTMNLLSLKVGDVPPEDDFAGMKKTFLKGGTWEYPILADLDLVDNATDKKIDSVKGLRLMGVPRFTPLYGYLVDGSWRYVQNQLRLKSGAYSVVTKDGFYETQVMTAKGFNFTVDLDPKTQIFTLTPSTSSAALKLLPILEDLGLASIKIQAVWGQDLYRINSQKAMTVRDSETPRLYRLLFNKTVDKPQAVTELNAYFEGKTKIDETTTKRTLGKSFSTVGPDLFLSATRRLLEMSKGQSEPDDRNSMANKELHSVDTFLREYIAEAKDKIRLQVLRQIEKRDSIRESISPAYFSKPIQSFFSNSTLSNVLKQTNPVQMMGEQFKVSLMGEGGIQTERAVTEEVRQVHPSQAGLIDPLHTPESSAIGTTLSVTMGSVKKGNELAQHYINAKTGKLEDLTAREVTEKTIAFPGQFEESGGKWIKTSPFPEVKVLIGSRETVANANQVDLIMPSAKGMFTISSNLIPFLNSNAGPRSMMGSKHVEQALPLMDPEAPLVQAQAAPGLTFERVVGAETSTSSQTKGTVSKITDDAIFVKKKNGEEVRHGIFNFTPLNEKTYLHSTPIVDVGDKVEAGQPLADSNFSKNGVLAMGKNMRVAYLPWKEGHSFEDGVVISESAAQKLTSLHMYKTPIQGGDGILLDKRAFLSRYPTSYLATQVSKLDDKGIVKVGQILTKGDPIALRLVKEELAPEDKILAKLRRGSIDLYKNRSVIWEEDFEGEVGEVVQSGQDYMVAIRTKEGARLGDKTSVRFGGKGIISRIIPDAEMPHTKAGEPMEVLLNPQGVLGRMNLGQTMENLASKVAMKTGDVIHVDNFSEQSSNLGGTEHDVAGKVMALAKEHGISDKEDLIDPETGATISNVATGWNYLYKLNHPVRAKFSARATGPYQADMTPTKGDAQGGQSMDMLTVYSLLAHGADKNVQEMSTLKGQANPEFWRAYRLGQPLPPLKTPESFNRFTQMLQGAGVNVERRGHELLLSPLLDKDVMKFSNGEIQKPLQALGKNLAPEKAGLFDPKITGGMNGEGWGHITLAEPVPHPTFEGTIKTLTGLKQAQFDGLVDGRLHVDPKTGEINEEGRGITGGAGIKHLLKQIDVDERMAHLESKMDDLSGDKLDKANKEYRYLNALKITDRKPEDLVISKLPVLPPKLRPMYADEAGNMRHSDLNYLYRDTMLVNQALNGLKELPDSEKTRQRAGLYDAVKALVGLGDSTIIQGKERKGILTNIAGVPQPKLGYFQNKVLKKRQDLSGRSTIIVAPELGVDQIGIPLDMAWQIFRERGLREMVARGKTLLIAQEDWEKKTPEALDTLKVVMKDNPVLLNRAPSLHKFSIMAAEPILTTGKAIGLHPLITKGLNADFDGDTIAIHVPVLPKSIEEAKKMLPSQNLFNPRDNSLIVMPDQEALQGLYLMTKDSPDPKQKPVHYEDWDAISRDSMQRKIAPNTPVTWKALQGVTTSGRLAVELNLPVDMRNFGRAWTKQLAVEVLTELAKKHPKDFPVFVNRIKDLGNKNAYYLGATLGVSDLMVSRTNRDAIIGAAQKASRVLDRNDKLSIQERDDKKLVIFQEADKRLMEEQKKILGGDSDNQIALAMRSGSKGKPDQVKQMLVAPVLFDSGKGKSIPLLVGRSLAEGLDPADYWIATYGARKGMIDKTLSTSKPGELSKTVLNAVGKFVITMKDCGTKRGSRVMLSNKTAALDAIGNLLSRPIEDMPAGTVLTAAHIKKLLTDNVTSVEIRSPLTCEAPRGICAMCYGLLPDRGSFPAIGDNVGAIAAQSVGEQLTQAVLKSFHTAGVASAGQQAGVTSQFDRIDNLLNVPKTLSFSATLAENHGEVEKVEEAAAGGTHVTIDGELHFVKPGLEVLVKPGQKVEMGDRISAGIINPHDVMRLKGPEEARAFISKELHETYNNGGSPIRKVHTDLVARAMTNWAKVTHSGDLPDIIPGDVGAVSTLEAFKTQAPAMEVPIDHAAARILAKDVGGLKAGLLLDPTAVKRLKDMGIRSVTVDARQPQYQAMLTPVSQVPIKSTDWLSRLGATELKKTISEGASRLWRSNIHGPDPVPALAYGQEFAEGELY